jgi:hypothetical protein
MCFEWGGTPEHHSGADVTIDKFWRRRLPARPCGLPNPRGAGPTGMRSINLGAFRDREPPVHTRQARMVFGGSGRSDATPQARLSFRDARARSFWTPGCPVGKWVRGTGDNAILCGSVGGRMAPDKETEPALAAPGIGELLATPQPSLIGPRSLRRRRGRVFNHVQFEFDLAPTPTNSAGVPLLERLAQRLKERRIVEHGTLVQLAAATLHALSSQGFRRVDHWEIVPGGWLPLPAQLKDPGAQEPVGDLLELLESGAWSSIASARSFSARMSDFSGGRADVIVRRVHRLRHALTLKLWRTMTKDQVEDLKEAIDKRLPVSRATMTRFGYVDG